MAAFNKKENSGGRRGRSGRTTGTGTSKTGDEKKKDGYKAKRSFSKNKSFRDLKLTKEETGGERKPFRSRPFDRSDKPGFKKREAGDREGKARSERESGDREKTGFRKRDSATGYDRENKGRGERERGSGFKPRTERDAGSSEKPSFRKREDRDGADRERTERKRPASREGERGPRDRDAGSRQGDRSSRGSFDKREKSSREDRPQRRDDKREFKSGSKNDSGKETRRVKYDEFQDGKAFSRENKESKKAAPQRKNDDGLVRLNKYLSNAGIASRRDADQLIQSGVVAVNGVVVDQLGYKIKPGDKVTYSGSAVKSERKVYLLLNKPKDYITTMEDPRDRKTVMELIEGACRERIYPVGRLDRNTTGLLLFTNDGELTTRLTHPKFGVKKVYHVTLNKGLKPDDFSSIIEGVELEDGLAKADDLAFVGEGKKEIGIEIHSGKNRIVRRIFEHLGYDVLKLDRVVFAGLTKKDLPRGKHRFLTAKEISFLHMVG